MVCAKLDHWEEKKKALVCSGCQFLWCKYSNMANCIAPIWYHCLWTAELGREACNSFSRVSEPMPAVTDYLCLFLYFMTTIWFFKRVWANDFVECLSFLVCLILICRFSLFTFWQECHRSDAVFFAMYHSRRPVIITCLITRDTRRDVTFGYHAVCWSLNRFLPCKDKLHFIP